MSILLFPPPHVTPLFIFVIHWLIFKRWISDPSKLKRFESEFSIYFLFEDYKTTPGLVHREVWDNPIETFIWEPTDPNPLQKLDAMFDFWVNSTHQNLSVVGFLSYEAGFFLERKFVREWESNQNIFSFSKEPLALWASFSKPHTETKRVESLDSETIHKILSEWKLGDLSYSEDDYIQKINTIRSAIQMGDFYEINFTQSQRIQALVSNPNLFSLFQAITQRQRTAYNCYMDWGEGKILSFSPELFFHKKGNSIITKPMKGTRKRGKNLPEDQSLKQELAFSEKERAENTMVTDLLRNDLSRVCVPGTVQVMDSFQIEEFQTLHQMTTTVQGELKWELANSQTFGWKEIFSSLFPGGSITGAPKIRCMERIREWEKGPRGIYTGTIGRIYPNQDAIFSIAIRTLISLEEETRIQFGSGIVWDSVASDEYKECLLKGEFLKPTPGGDFSLFETLRWHRGRFRLESRHRQRLQTSAELLGFPFSLGQYQEILSYFAKEEFDRSLRVRIELLKNGQLSFSKQLLQLGEEIPLTKRTKRKVTKIVLAPISLNSESLFLYHKTTFCPEYKVGIEIAKQNGYDDMIFTNQVGEWTESCIANLFLWSEEEKCYHTPPLKSGILPGVFRSYLLERFPRLFQEKVIPKNRIKPGQKVLFCNSLRGFWEGEVATSFSVKEWREKK